MEIRLLSCSWCVEALGKLLGSAAGRNGGCIILRKLSASCGHAKPLVAKTDRWQSTRPDALLERRLNLTRLCHAAGHPVQCMSTPPRGNKRSIRTQFSMYFAVYIYIFFGVFWCIFGPTGFVFSKNQWYSLPATFMQCFSDMVCHRQFIRTY